MARKSPQNRQQVLVKLENFLIQQQDAQGVVPREKFINGWENELHSDTTLLGFDFRTHAVSDCDAILRLRHPD